MSMIYEPKGKAREYCALALNLYRGCDHGCTYCYAPNATFTDRTVFHGQVRERPGILAEVAKEAPAYAGKEVHLCFTCDPYQALDDDLRITRRAIKILIAADVTVRILS